MHTWFDFLNTAGMSPEVWAVVWQGAPALAGHHHAARPEPQGAAAWRATLALLASWHGHIGAKCPQDIHPNSLAIIWVRDSVPWDSRRSASVPAMVPPLPWHSELDTQVPASPEVAEHSTLGKVVSWNKLPTDSDSIKTTKLILLDSLLQEMVVVSPPSLIPPTKRVKTLPFVSKYWKCHPRITSSTTHNSKL